MCCLFDKLSRAAAKRRRPLPFPEHDSSQQYVGKPPWWYYEDGTPMPDEDIAAHLQAADGEAEDERKRAPPLSKSAPKAKAPYLKPKIPPKATPRGTYQVGGSSSSTSGGAAIPAATPVIDLVSERPLQPAPPFYPPPDWDEAFRRVPKVPVMVPPTEEPPSVPNTLPIPVGKFGDGIPLPPWRREKFGSPTVAPPPTWSPPPPAPNHQQQMNSLNWHKQHAINMMNWGVHIAKLMTYHGSHLPQPKPPTEVHTPEIPTAPINPFLPPLAPPPPPPSRPHAATPTPPLDPVLQARNLWEETPIPPPPPLHPEQEAEAPPPHPVVGPDRSPTPEYSPNGSHFSEGWEQVERALPKPMPVPVSARAIAKDRGTSPEPPSCPSTRSSSSSSSGSSGSRSEEGVADNLSDLSLSLGPIHGPTAETIDSQTPPMQARAM